MSECYKCGRALPGTQIECDVFCIPTAAPTEAEQEELANDWFEIDWDKVTTFEEMKRVMRIGAYSLLIHRDDPELASVKHLLKEKTP